MNPEDYVCPYCDSEFTIDNEDEDSVVAFCPYCGEEFDADNDGEDDYYEDTDEFDDE